MPDATSLLGSVTQQLPRGGEARPGQVEMAEAVADAVDDDATLLVEAGTGTGKSLAYLTPIIASGRRAVVATATIALQGQLVEHDIPQVAAGLGQEVSIALVKGRRNYLCLQRLAEFERTERSEQMNLLGAQDPSAKLSAIADWAERTATGDREELDPAPPAHLWSVVSVGADECPGATKCPSGEACFAERARHRAADADVIVTNHHYYGIHLATDGELLPDHEIVVFDEAHQLADTLGATCGTELGGTTLKLLARRLRGLLTDDELATKLELTATRIDDQLRPLRGRTVEFSAELIAQLTGAQRRAADVLDALRRINAGEGTDVAARLERARVSASKVAGDIDAILDPAESDVLWVDGSDIDPMLRRTPLDVGPILNKQLWGRGPVILTSATLADGVVDQLGLEQDDNKVLRVGSPFDYAEAGLLYCATDLPDPRADGYREAVQAEIAALAAAAGGRTLALFTSYRAMTEAVDTLAETHDGPVLAQGTASRDALVAKLRDEPGAVLCATMSFWQGVDIPGDALTLVTIDRLPFARPDEPVFQARRDRAGPAAFRLVDLPRAQTLLAQAAGRLIRRSTDRGVVAVLDSRLATNKSYRWDLINALPPFKRTKDRDEVLDFLTSIDAEARDGPDSEAVQ